jgi:hypothetical protein
MIRNRVVPILWQQKHQSLTYTRDVFKDSDQESNWIDAGHHPGALSVELHMVKQPYEWMTYLHQYFDDLKNLSFCFSKFLPGTYFPSHTDKYGFYSKANNIQDLSQIIRYVVFLEDAQPGHILQVGDKIYHNWPQGLCVGWDHSTPHLAANLGLEDRYTLQVTGTKK